MLSGRARASRVTKLEDTDEEGRREMQDLWAILQ